MDHPNAEPPAGSEGPVSRLRWYPERGFELDLNAAVDDVTLMLVAVPLPADGTDELRGDEPLDLDKLEILFKAQVDVAGAPGQLTEATVHVGPGAAGEILHLVATVEDAESGETRAVTVRVPVEVPSAAPTSGGPRPDPADEAELDWDDDDTHEAFFKDPLTQEDPLPGAPLPTRSSDDAPPEPAPTTKAAERGFDRLLRALLADDSQFDDVEVEEDADEDEPLVAEDPASAAASQRLTSGGTVLSLVGTEEPGADPLADEGPPQIDDPADARGLLEFLVEREALELEEGHTVDELVAGAAPVLASPKPPSARAAALAEWLFSQDAVAELYIDDDSLAGLIERW